MQPELPDYITILRLGERAYELSFKEDTLASKIRSWAEMIRREPPEELEDLIQSYSSIALIFKSPQRSSEKLQQYVASLSSQEKPQADPRTLEIAVDYDQGLDWDILCSHTGLSKSEIIQIHCAQDYEVAAIGFLPGFVYLSGLPETLHCPRRSDPRTSVPAGSVGIGGSHTGIYSLSSPGGWQIIGRSAQSLFEAEKEPPMELKAGDRIRFLAISKENQKGG